MAATQPEDLYKGARVRYGKQKQRGVVSQAFNALDEFWVNDEASGQPVRNKDGAQTTFRAAELELADGTTRRRPSAMPSLEESEPTDGASAARVLLIGTRNQMIRILEHFGPPDEEERRDPQIVLALPCNECVCGPTCEAFDPTRLEMCQFDCPAWRLARDGIDASLLKLAQRLRPDIRMRVRPFFLKQTYEQIGPTLGQLNDHYCLAAVSLPFGQEEIAACSKTERYWKEEVRCQVDLNTSAEGFLEAGDSSLVQVARRSLGEACNVALSTSIWSSHTQKKIREALGVKLPLFVWDGSETKVFIMLLPEDATIAKKDGLLTFSEARTAAPTGSTADDGKASTERKTVADWRQAQDEFKDETKLPEGWIRVKSKTGSVYFWNVQKKQSTFDFPLPDGWTKEISKSTGKPYYFNAKKRKSSFEIPKEE